MDLDRIKDYYENNEVVREYVRGANNVGLWKSEKLLFEKYFEKDKPLLDLGCGAGRIAFGLWALGYSNIIGIDLSKNMIKEAKNIAKHLKCPVQFEVQDACKLPFEDNSFNSAIFGFNGLMQIPKQSKRIKAMKEIVRVLKPGSFFIFTSHSRDASFRKEYWRHQEDKWKAGIKNPKIFDLGDFYIEMDRGTHYIHVPVFEEMKKDLESSGFEYVDYKQRSKICNEPSIVRNFADDCYFWIVKTPEA